MQATIFAIDTAGERCSLALSHAGSVEVFAGEAGRTHLEDVLPRIEELFARCGLVPGQCDAFAFASGPGSFTGLRVACTIVQGLAFATARPVVAVGSLHALVCAAQGASRAGEAVAAAARATAGPRAHNGCAPGEQRGRRRGFAVVDARMQQMYWAVYEETGSGRGKRGWTEIAAPSLGDANQLQALLADWEVDFCAGDERWIRRHVADSRVPVCNTAVDGAIIVRLAQDELAAGNLLRPELAIPEYVRDRVAQTVAERRDAGGLRQ